MVFRLNRTGKWAIGITLFIAAILVYLYFTYTFSSGIYGDTVTWFHAHVINYLNNGGDPHSDHYLRFVGGRDLSRSPILLDELISASGLSSSVMSLSLALILLTLIFIGGILSFKDPVTAGLSSLVFSVTPAFLYWFKTNMFGAYTLVSLWLIPIILFWIGFKRDSTYINLIAALTTGILWLFWPGAWFLILLYAIYLAHLVYSGNIRRIDLLTGLALLVFTLPLNVLFNYYAMVSYHILSYTLLAS
jgi:hypothetical protein